MACIAVAIHPSSDNAAITVSDGLDDLQRTPQPAFHASRNAGQSFARAEEEVPFMDMDMGASA
jgi:hypothetical protein